MPEENERLIEGVTDILYHKEEQGNEKTDVAGGIPAAAVRSADRNQRLMREKPATEARNLQGRSGSSRTTLNGFARPKTPAIMIQGTTSNAGKSILTAAFGRILLQDGIKVAPFKAQNMSLNSFVTPDGGEMGRAQVVQAQACRLDPDVRMNPILIKPNSDTGSQVILNGKPVGNMNVKRYTQYKREAVAAVHECYDSLSADYEAVVIEGAGSPGEVNLKKHDLVNMQMARYAQSPVLLVGDIDRGGVFASFTGHMEVFNEWERDLTAGYIVNRFRGDPTLLNDAYDYMLEHTGKPVLGTIPYVRDLGLPEEDSVEFKSGRSEALPAGVEKVDVAVVDLPHISNFTDLDSLSLEPDVHLRIVRDSGELGAPDAIILPGSKNTIGDLSALNHSGMTDRIKALASMGTCEIVGICGGFQMLGRTISDPDGIESDGQPVPGLGLLDIQTSMAQEKTLERTTATHRGSGEVVHGYEIHHGQTTFGQSCPAFSGSGGETLGATHPDQKIWGTYLHGVFDADEFRRWFVDSLRQRKGWAPIGRVCAKYDIEPALDRLADIVRKNMDMGAIYQLLGRG